jgi:hypothetical protein
MSASAFLLVDLALAFSGPVTSLIGCQIGPRVDPNRPVRDSLGVSASAWSLGSATTSYTRLLALDGDEAHAGRVEGEAERHGADALAARAPA